MFPLCFHFVVIHIQSLRYKVFCVDKQVTQPWWKKGWQVEQDWLRYRGSVRNVHCALITQAIVVWCGGGHVTAYIYWVTWIYSSLQFRKIHIVKVWWSRCCKQGISKANSNQWVFLYLDWVVLYTLMIHLSRTPFSHVYEESKPYFE